METRIPLGVENLVVHDLYAAFPVVRYGEDGEGGPPSAPRARETSRVYEEYPVDLFPVRNVGVAKKAHRGVDFPGCVEQGQKGTCGQGGVPMGCVDSVFPCGRDAVGWEAGVRIHITPNHYAGHRSKASWGKLVQVRGAVAQVNDEIQFVAQFLNHELEVARVPVGIADYEYLQVRSPPSVSAVLPPLPRLGKERPTPGP